MTISRRTLVFASLVALAVLTYACWPGRRWDYKNFPPTATGPWVAFGDSLTLGIGAENGGYPALLGSRLGVPLQNLGVAGETTEDGLRRVAEVEALEPRVVLLCFGGNDMLRGRSREQMFANLGTMIDRLQARGSFVVLLGIPGASVLRDANAAGFRQLAEEKQVLHLPNLLDGLLSTPSLMSDYVHPNDAGYEKIAARLELELRPLLEKLNGK